MAASGSPSTSSAPWGRLVVALLATGSAAAAAVFVQEWRKARRRRFGGLDTVVGFSARAVAAARALETQREDALFRDPLALALAGPQAMARARTMLEKRGAAAKAPAAAEEGAASEAQGAAAAAGSDAVAAASPADARSVGRIVMRTLAFDSAVLLSTCGQEPPFTTRGLREAWELAGKQRCTQVVLLGAGMDTRAWRLELPPGVAWFEVDTADVLGAKRAIMTRAGAQWPERAALVDGEGGRRVAQRRAQFEGEGDATVTVEGKGRKDAAAAAQPLPYRAASYAGVAVDLQQRGWSAALMAAGFSGGQRTLWVLEGLTYYLEPDSVPGLFKEMADVSASGSLAIVSAVPAWMVERLKAGASGGKGGKRGGGGGDDGAGGRQGRPWGNIMSAWKWGVPGTEEEAWGSFFASCGWRTTSFDLWSDLVRECGFVPDEMFMGPRRRGGGEGEGDGGEQQDPGRKFSMLTAVKAW